MTLFRRRAARVVLLDPDDRVLLFRLGATADPDGRGYWYLPGGGIRPFESVESAALRELREETGIHDVVAGPLLGERRGVAFRFAGRQIVQDEWYVAARVGSAWVGKGRHGDGERRAVEDHRWWTPDELAATNETVHPPGLGDLLIRAAVLLGRGP